MPYFNIQVRGFERTPPPPPPPSLYPQTPLPQDQFPQDKEALFQVLSSLTDWVCRGLFALLVHAVMSCNCSMRRFSFHCFAIRADQNTCHHAQGTESCRHELNQITCTLWQHSQSSPWGYDRIAINFFWLPYILIIILCTLSFIPAHIVLP